MCWGVVGGLVDLAPYLGDGVVDVHGGDGEFARLGELVEAVDAGDALLHNALHKVKHGLVFSQHQMGRIASVVKNLSKQK